MEVPEGMKGGMANTGGSSSLSRKCRWKSNADRIMACAHTVNICLCSVKLIALVTYTQMLLAQRHICHYSIYT